MKAEFAGKYHSFFARMINCELPQGAAGTPVGVTRTGEVSDFVDAFMADWTGITDSSLSLGSAALTLQQQQALLHQRFCTYAEFRELHTAPPYQRSWDAIVFKLLGITNASQQSSYKKRFPPDREGYFKLMEILHPQLRSFFFPAVRYLYPCCRTGKAHLPCRGYGVG